MKSKMKSILIFFVGLVITACATSPTGRSQLMLVSPRQAVAMSRDAYVQVLAPLRQQGKINTNARVTARVRKITGQLVAQAVSLYPHTRNWGWSVAVIEESKTLNAWCMAGGKMAIYTGLLEKIKLNDDELAQVMAHEISHALANHTAEKMSMALATQLGLAGVSVMTRDNRHAGAIMQGSSMAAALAVTLPNSRAAEIEADRMGIELAARSGYNPHAAASLWRKMENASGGGPPQFLSTHPSPYNRQQTLAGLAEKMMPYYRPEQKHPVYPLQAD